MDKKKILLIEDELFVIDLYDRILTQEGYQVLKASDGEQGLELAKQKPDLILLDIMMPKVNGLEILKRLKSEQDTKNIRVILLTNLGQETVIKQAFKLGAEGYLLKMRLTPYEVAAHVRDFFNKTDST